MDFLRGRFKPEEAPLSRPQAHKYVSARFVLAARPRNLRDLRGMQIMLISAQWFLRGLMTKYNKEEENPVILEGIVDFLIDLRLAILPPKSWRDKFYRTCLRPFVGRLVSAVPRKAKPKTTAAEKTEWYEIVRLRGTGPVKKFKEIARPWNQFSKKLGYNQHVVFDLEVGLKRGAKGIALVFFMGMGDYFYATPFLAALRRRFEGVPIHAYVSSVMDANNAPLVAKLLENDPNVDAVFTFKGMISPDNWKNYEYTEVYEKAPADFLVVPLLYEYSRKTRSRVMSLFETFSLPRPLFMPWPIIPLPKKPAEAVFEMRDAILACVAKKGLKGVVFLQLDARSSGYSYPHGDALAQRLWDEGYATLSVAKHEAVNEAGFVIDIKKFTITDSIYLLKLLKESLGDKIALLTIVSVFWSVSSSLGIRNVGMQHFLDPGIHNVWYPNIFVISHIDYPTIPVTSLCLARRENYELDEKGYATFSPDFVIKVFLETQKTQDRSR